jgi:hypothetical protein
MEYGYKSPVFFGPPSCGSGCGLIGSKGIEISGFNEIFYHIQNDLNVTRDIIIAYEFGRNFSNESLQKIISPNTEKNGGFYEEFASYMAFKFYDQFLTGEERNLNETLVNDFWFKQKFLGYINDLDATPENSLFNWDKIQMQDMNRGNFGNNDYDPSYSGSILIGILKTLNIEPRKFLESLSNLSRPSTSIDAQSNIAIASSISKQKDFTYFFKNVLKFSLSSESIRIMSNYPSPVNSLIRDLEELYFINNTDSITLNIRSVLHNRTDKEILYRLYRDDYTKEIISESSNGNNSIP